MDEQLRIGETCLAKSTEADPSTESPAVPNGEEGAVADYELHSEGNPELSDAATLEQRRAYKIELQVDYCFIN